MALLIAGGAPPAFSQNFQITTTPGNVIVPSTTFTSVTGSNVSVGGSVINTGKIQPTVTGISINNNATLVGGLTNVGTISGGAVGILDANATILGGISNSGSGTISGRIYGILVGATSRGGGAVSSFSGGISNAGTISGGSGAGISVQQVGIFGGGISNSGTISSAGGNGIWVGGQVSNSTITISTFLGGISNSGTISAANQGIFVGGRATSGPGSVTIQKFSGGITNSGNITARTGILVGGAAFGPGNTFTISSFSGGVSNSGTITARRTGIAVVASGTFGGVASISTFAGGISNSGVIIATGANSVGIETAGLTTFLNGITNSGLISVGANGAGIVVGASFFYGNVSNSGTITGGHTGIFICNCVTFQGGAIVNSGVISASTNAIQAAGASSAVTVDQVAGTVTGAILLPTAPGVAGTLNVYGGTINGNIIGGSTAGSDVVNFAPNGPLMLYGGTISGVQAVNFNSGVVVDAGPITAGSVSVNSGAVENLGTIAAGNVFVNSGTLFDGGTITAGNVFVNSGTLLAITGTITTTGGVFVNSGGLLGDASTIAAAGGVFVNSGGVLEPGSPLSITGNLTVNSGGAYEIQLTPTQHASATVTGGLNINNGTVLLAPSSTLGATYSATTFSILTYSGTLTGAFNQTVGYAGAVALSTTPTISYTANNVNLSYGAGIADLATPAGANANQQNVINGLNTAILGGANIPAGLQQLTNLSGQALLNAYSHLSGEPGTDAGKGVNQLMSDFLELMLDPTAGGGGGISGGGANSFAPEQDSSLPADVALAYARALRQQTQQTQTPQNFDQRWTAWGSAFGGASHIDGDATAGTNNVTASDFGFAAGMDYRATPNFTYGFGLAGGGTNWNLAQGLGSGRSDSFQFGVYAKTHAGPFYLSGALAFANHWFTTDRTALGDQLQAKFDGQSYAARGEAGYRYGLPVTGTIIGVTPYAALQVQDFHTPSYSETDLTGGGLGLSYNSANATDTRSELGARLDNLQVVYGMPLVLRGRLAWAHDWVSGSSLGAAFQTLPGSAFTVNGAAQPQNSALTTAAAELHLTANWTAIAKFDGEFASGAQTYGGTGTLKYSW